MVDHTPPPRVDHAPPITHNAVAYGESDLQPTTVQSTAYMFFAFGPTCLLVDAKDATIRSTYGEPFKGSNLKDDLIAVLMVSVRKGFKGVCPP
eukprot:1380588-Amphidinium_carterae.1